MNIAHRISKMALLHPEKKSVVFSKAESCGYSYPFYTFKEFEERSSQMAHYFLGLGISKGTRTLLFVKPCLDFSVITFALFKIGAIPVLIDPGMGLKNLLSSVKQVKPEALISIGKVHWLRRLKSNSFSSVKINISLTPVGGKTHFLYQTLSEYPKTFDIVPMDNNEPSAILFTSGGTGIPKGVEYTHGILNAQTDALQKMFSLTENDIDLPGFPLFALFTLAMGMTSVIPDMDPTKPAATDPKKIVQNIIHNQVTFVAGSPSIWEKVGNYCQKNNIVLGSLKYVVMFGAPVRPHIHHLFKKILPYGDTFTPYGATECLPVSLMKGSELPVGVGICVGEAVPQTLIGIIKASDIPESELILEPAGTIGEIVVHGPQVTPSYFEMPQETEKAKIWNQNKLWHRMGDVGYLDSENRLWFLGRKTHVVNGDFYPIEIETVFNQHPKIKRTALIKVNLQGKITPGLVIEKFDHETGKDLDLKSDLEKMKRTHPKTQKINDFFLHSDFPVDVRHNIKIDRVKLGELASLGKLNKL